MKWFKSIKTISFLFIFNGGLAQLAEHNICNVGVRGSNPLSSTKSINYNIVIIFMPSYNWLVPCPFTAEMWGSSPPGMTKF